MSSKIRSALLVVISITIVGVLLSFAPTIHQMYKANKGPIDQRWKPSTTQQK